MIISFFPLTTRTQKYFNGRAVKTVFYPLASSTPNPLPPSSPSPTSLSPSTLLAAFPKPIFVAKNMELDLRSLFGLHVHSCMRPRIPPAPLPLHLGFLYKGAIGQQRWTTSQRDPLVSYLYFPCSHISPSFPYTSFQLSYLHLSSLRSSVLDLSSISPVPIFSFYIAPSNAPYTLYICTFQFLSLSVPTCNHSIFSNHYSR
jgi:hypothetical protein